jgi:thiamine kinase-like enzyme
LEFDCVDGVPLGPKYPSTLESADVGAMIELTARLRTYNPRRRWLRRYNAQRRLTSARLAGLLTVREAERLSDVAAAVHQRLRFGHGDVTARNVLRAADEFVLIDWEWSGLYPNDYDLAFLWYSLVDMPDGRAVVEAHCSRDERSFLLSALLIQLRHLQWYVPAEFRSRHLETRDELTSRLLPAG